VFKWHTDVLTHWIYQHAYFYYPIINRAIVELHLMEPHTPQALLLLNIVFMGACKHLGRSTDIKRAIQFRERARGSFFFTPMLKSMPHCRPFKLTLFVLECQSILKKSNIT
jgi:hypothetical protein